VLAPCGHAAVDVHAVTLPTQASANYCRPAAESVDDGDDGLTASSDITEADVSNFQPRTLTDHRHSHPLEEQVVKQVCSARPYFTVTQAFCRCTSGGQSALSGKTVHGRIK